MKTKKTPSLDCKSLIILTGIMFALTNLALGYDLENYYPLTEANSWTYLVTRDKKISEETYRIQGKKLINGVETVRIGDSEVEYKCLALDFQGIKEHKDYDSNIYRIFSPPKIVFPNIEIGESRRYSVNFITYNVEGTKIREGNESGQILLESVEDLEVPAGRFAKCLKYSFTFENKEISGDFEKNDHSVWLAPSVGKVKEFSFSIGYDAETKKIETDIETYELISAVVDGKKIGGQ